MTNFEKYKDEILGIIESNGASPAVVCGKPMACDEVVSCGDCSFRNNEASCDALFIKWLYEEVMFDCDLKFEPKPKEPEMKPCP